MQDLAKLNPSEFATFLQSFDHVLFDVDGVIYKSFKHKIPGAEEAIKLLRQLGKNIVFVTNNSARFYHELFEELKSGGFAKSEDELATPALAIIDYLKEKKFDREIFGIASIPLQTIIKDAGFKFAEELPKEFAVGNPGEALRVILKDVSSIGAVLIDADVNTSFPKLQRAVEVLKQPDTLYLVGGADKFIPYAHHVIIGPGTFIDIVSNLAGRQPTILGKPSVDFNNYLKKKYKLNNPARVLFVGDSVPSDMGFAANCGYQKFLVLSGLTRREELTNWTYPEEEKPDYYADSLQILYEKLILHK